MGQREGHAAEWVCATMQGWLQIELFHMDLLCLTVSGVSWHLIAEEVITEGSHPVRISQSVPYSWECSGEMLVATLGLSWGSVCPCDPANLPKWHFRVQGL